MLETRRTISPCLSRYINLLPNRHNDVELIDRTSCMESRKLSTRNYWTLALLSPKSIDSLKPLGNQLVSSTSPSSLSRNGDLNVLGPFVPFASPVDKLWVLSEVAKKKPTPENRKALEAEQAIARNSPKSKYPNRGFRCVMKVFRDEKVGVVVRLNNDL